MSAPEPAPPQRQAPDSDRGGWGGDEPVKESPLSSLLPVILMIGGVVALGVLIVLAHVTGIMPRGLHGGGH
jgi:hypothetical protein